MNNSNKKEENKKRGEGQKKARRENLKDTSMTDDERGAALIEAALANISGDSTRSKKRSFYLPEDDENNEMDDNDDAAENKNIRQQAKKVHREEKSDPQNRPNFISKFSSDDLENHFSTCISLFAKNKVNVKNAFKLHLIDYMHMVVETKAEKSENLTVMGCTLDASAKIYSCRVDKVYNDLLKVISGKEVEIEDQPETEKKESSTDEYVFKETGGILFDENGFVRLSEEYKDAGQQFIVKDLSTIQRKTIERAYFPTSLPPGIDYFLELPFSGGSYRLNLNAKVIDETPPTPVKQPCLIEIGPYYENGPDEDNFEEMIPGYEYYEKMFFVKEESEADVAAASSSLEKSVPNFPDPDPMIFNNDDFDDDDDAASEGGRNVNMEIDYDEGLTEASRSAGMAAIFESLKKKKKPTSDKVYTAADFAPSSLCKMLNFSTSANSRTFFDESQLEFMPLPEYWKVRPIKKDNASKTPAVKRGDKKKQLLRVTKEALQGSLTCLNDSNESAVLSNKTLQIWFKNKSKNQMDLSIILAKNKLFCLNGFDKVFIWKSKKFIDVEAVDESFDLNPEDFASHDAADVDDDQAGGADDATDFTEPTDLNPNVLSSQIIRNDITGLSSQNTTMISVPQKVQKIDLKYTKARSFIDIRKLKSTMWNILKVEKDPETQKEKSVNEKKFEDLLFELPQHVEPSVSQNLSVHQQFLALLYLCNEHNLSLEKVDPKVMSSSITIHIPE